MSDEDARRDGFDRINENSSKVWIVNFIYYSRIKTIKLSGGDD